ncbi:PREDICTED: anoctamin-3-like [Nicrophorus vespilloides]|uniref:Anoctamin n=1 Tax=Nicrophorus vespilloides TaxID=110193 RepID=A0ABM1MNF1_NICVS|nr:PREDICTED: anoctamin-3-like [Nicrophorus vespilloides]
MDKLAFYINGLRKAGVEIEIAKGGRNNDLVFIKLHCVLEVLMEIVKAHNIVLEKQNLKKMRESAFYKQSFVHTICSRPDPKNPLTLRAPQTLSGNNATTMTSAERTLALHRLIIRTKFSNEFQDRGITRMITQGILINAYPLHDSTLTWPEQGPISDRQLLGRFWSRLSYFYKMQPLHLIRKYYGPEVAFYFAFLGFYNRMLVPAALVGLLCFIIVFLTLDDENPLIRDYCKSDAVMCPRCLDARYCNFVPLKYSCEMAKIVLLFDNSANIIYSILMSFWSTIFMQLWKRREIELRFKWNLMTVEANTATRLQYYERTKYRRPSKFTGEEEPYIPNLIKSLNYSVTVFSCLCMIFIVVLAIFSAMMIKFTVAGFILGNDIEVLKNHLNIIIMALSSLINLIFMKIFAPIYTKLAILLTIRENPRTYVEFHNSCIYKSYMLGFANSYFPVFYLALIKGRLYTHPGDMSVKTIPLYSDLCHPPGCIVGITILLLFVLLFRSSVGQIIVIVIRLLKRGKAKLTKVDESTKLPSWERDYKLENNPKFCMLKDYMEIAIQYGFVTFFISALPLAPLLALLNNIIEIRLDAVKRVATYKRPLISRLPGIGAWNVVFQLATRLGILTNAFVIAFTSNTITREIHRFETGSMKNFVNTTLSAIDLDSECNLRKYHIRST